MNQSDQNSEVSSTHPASNLPGTEPKSPPNKPPVTVGQPRKVRRITRACDFCHLRSVRCRPSTEDGSKCHTCVELGAPCTYNRPVKKRGIRSGTAPSKKHKRDSSMNGENDARMLLELTKSSNGVNGGDRFSVPSRWKDLILENEGIINNLVDVYFEVVYPIFPLAHGPTLLRRLANKDHLTDHAFFTEVMSVCALASARVRDGALLPGKREPNHFEIPSPESFYTVAKEHVPQDLGSLRGLEWMRTCAMMALYGIQVGKLEIMHQYLGLYHSLVAMDNLHNEENWPSSTGIVETELRRRLFWSMYSLEVCSSIVWGSTIRCREAQSQVPYPSEVDDVFFSDAGYNPPESLSHGFLATQPIQNPLCWLHGWNFTTSLYRTLEHAVDELGRKAGNYGADNHEQLAIPLMFEKRIASPAIGLQKIMLMHDDLPVPFKEARLAAASATSNKKDRFSFQAANITTTLKLARTTFLAPCNATLDQQCATAQDTLLSLSTIPVYFLRAVSPPLLHNMGGINRILDLVLEKPLSELSQAHVKGVLQAMIDLLKHLEVGITRPVAAVTQLRNQINKLDSYINTQRPQTTPDADIKPQITPMPPPALVQHNYQLPDGSHNPSHSHPEQKSNNTPYPLQPNPQNTHNPNIDPGLQQSTSSSSSTSLSTPHNNNTTAPTYPTTFPNTPSNTNTILGSGPANGVSSQPSQIDPITAHPSAEIMENWSWSLEGGQGFGASY